MKHQTPDIVIPLGSGSKHNNFELRMALRGIDRFVRDPGQVYIVSDQLPEWVQNVIHLPADDPHKHNKDANIIDKLLLATACPELSEEFIFWSDDQILLKPCCLHKLPAIYNPRRRRDFNAPRIWHRRMRNTFDYLQKRNKFLECNYESHTPQRFNKKLFSALFRSADYAREPGYCINTLYFGFYGTGGKLEQSMVKSTCEQPLKLNQLPADKLFLGYNDAALQGGLKPLLEAYFPTPCSYEKY